MRVVLQPKAQKRRGARASVLSSYCTGGYDQHTDGCDFYLEKIREARGIAPGLRGSAPVNQVVTTLLAGHHRHARIEHAAALHTDVPSA